MLGVKMSALNQQAWVVSFMCGVGRLCLRLMPERWHITQQCGKNCIYSVFLHGAAFSEFYLKKDISISKKFACLKIDNRQEVWKRKICKSRLRVYWNYLCHVSLFVTVCLLLPVNLRKLSIGNFS